MLKVLIADDAEMTRKNLVAMLSDNENIDNIIEAQDGKEELEKIIREQPDIVFTDMKMPLMDGIDVIHLQLIYYR